MKKIFLITLTMLISAATFAIADNLSEDNGNNWIGWPQSQKLAYIGGFVVGAAYVSGYGQGSISFCSLEGQEYDQEKALKVWDSFFKKNSFRKHEVSLLVDSVTAINSKSLSKFGIYKITVKQIVEGLDSFYYDFKNKKTPVL